MKHLKSIDNSTNKSVTRRGSSANNAATWTKKDILRALKRLAKRKTITYTKKGKYYRIAQDEGGRNIATNVDEDGDANDERSVPIAKRMRGKQPAMVNHADDTRNGDSEEVDLDEEIRRLEAELAADESDGESESDEEIVDNSAATSIHGNYDAGNEHTRKSNAQTQDVDDDNTGIICLSNLANDRIEPLPETSLPKNKRRMMKGVDSTSGTEILPNERKKKQKRAQSSSSTADHTVSKGLQDAVTDLLQSYIPSSQLDRPPFYCRVCQHQSSTQIEFDTHRSTDLHKVAVKEERKRTYCKLCKKQLTSLVQMEEHLGSRPHRERMDKVMDKQRGIAGGGSRGKGEKYHRGLKSGQGERQWC